ncbi:hypothetical protein BH762_gp161 [Gordonia phage OneUp]|uniref:Uncharacterized protein n=1 Tax=Gordonia phage OneUp TaxID=1838074 RepID=A0A160DEQ9_9CAUD|nr:hypothetical protein BH762_gp161 [Gordonia phage OneUp]ANA86358.1 hypothetical protein PBI_ONEUP_23 [Gordonia phage OneUp]
MAAQKPGPPPTGNAVRRNKDPNLQQQDWAIVDPALHDWDYPEIPDWIDSTPRTEAVYEFLMTLPQSRTWRQGEWFQIWMSLPTIERYFSRPGGETLKSIMGLLNVGLNLTQADMAKARMKFKEADPVEEELEGATKAKVVDLEARKKRLTMPSDSDGD